MPPPGAGRCVTVWADHLVALSAFLSGATQWRLVGGMSGIRAVGLDYAGVRAGLEAEGVSLAPHDWRALRLIEAGAIEAMNGDGS